MNLNLQDFVRTNKEILIWTAFFGLLWLLRGLFGLVFITFILCFIFNNLIDFLHGVIRLPKRLWTVILYLIFIGIVITLLSYVTPRLGSESTAFIRQLPLTIGKIQNYLDEVALRQPNLAPVILRIKDNIALESLIGLDRQAIMSLVIGSFNRITHYSSYFLAGVLFSFFILLDYPNLQARTRALRNTRMHEIYEETAYSVVQFALVVGEAFQAQILIACINTLMTAIGLFILDIQPIALLSTIVFFAGLIPVLGVFISSVPILLLAFNIDGFQLVLGALIMIIIVHVVEAYILNPRIFSAVFKMNPVLTLIILYIGHSIFGVWGILLGVPISVYLYRYAILGRAVVDSARAAKEAAKTESKTP